jgi:hypothetical protein
MRGHPTVLAGETFDTFITIVVAVGLGAERPASPDIVSRDLWLRYLAEN